MPTKKDEFSSGTSNNGHPDSVRHKLSRREFAKTSVVAGAVAVTIPDVIQASPQMSGGAAVTASESSGKTGAHSGTWREGTTIPAEYYLDEEHYKNDERYIAENFWLLADHVSRIPEPGDFFVFKFGLGESAIVVRNESNEIRAFHNVCRHRGSRLCRHDEDPRPNDDRLSVRQLGESGKAQVFRCPYHAWLYDLDGTLIDAYDTHDDFDMGANGLVPCHLRIEQGHIFLNFSRSGEPPKFDVHPDSTSASASTERLSWIGNKYSFKDLKIATRRSYPIRANWKLVLENFLECYHCGPSHQNLVKSMNYDYSLTDTQKQRRSGNIGHWLEEGSGDFHGMGYGDNTHNGELNPGFVTGSLDGKPVAPLLPAINDWSHHTDWASTHHSSAYWQCYDDHIVLVRFTPRGPGFTDGEISWLVHPDAVEGKDYEVERLMALFDITLLEDTWVIENNHEGVKSSGYRSGHFSKHEGPPANFITWYMQEVIKA